MEFSSIKPWKPVLYSLSFAPRGPLYMVSRPGATCNTVSGRKHAVLGLHTPAWVAASFSHPIATNKRLQAHIVRFLQLRRPRRSVERRNVVNSTQQSFLTATAAKAHASFQAATCQQAKRGLLLRLRNKQEPQQFNHKPRLLLDPCPLRLPGLLLACQRHEENMETDQRCNAPRTSALLNFRANEAVPRVHMM